MPAGFWDFADVGNLSGSGGIIKGHQLQKFMNQHMTAHNFNELQKRVIVAATDMVTGELYPIDNGPIAQAVVASSAIPGIVKPINLNGHTLIDGGVLSPVPVELARKLHPRIIIAVDISKRSGAGKATSTVDVVDSAVYIMGQRLTQMSLNDADVVISPKIGDVSLFDISKKREMYLAGLHAAREEIPKISRLLEQA
jgi:NTE family protein